MREEAERDAVESVIASVCVCARRHGQSVLHGAGGVGLGVADKERERRRSRERGRGDAEQAPDRVSPPGSEHRDCFKY